MREEPVPFATKLRVSIHLIPPIVIFGIVMGSLYSGLATATESAALGVTAVLFFVWRSGKMNWSLLRGCFISTGRVTVRRV